MLKQKINLRMANQDTAPIVNLVQNDTGREIECNILDFDIPAGATSTLWLIKPSKKISSCDGVISGNMVTVALTDQVVAEEGMCVAQLKITKDEKTLSSFTMYFNFEEDTSTNGIISQEDIKLVETFIQEQKKKLDAYLEGKGQDIEKLKKDMPTKLDKNQGQSNENKFMRVGADGNLIPDDVPIPDVSGQIKEHNENTDSHQDIRTELKKKANRGTTLSDYGITDAVPDSHLTDRKAHDDIRKETAQLKEDLVGLEFICKKENNTVYTAEKDVKVGYDINGKIMDCDLMKGSNFKINVHFTKGAITGYINLYYINNEGIKTVLDIFDNDIEKTFIAKEDIKSFVSAKYSCGFSILLVSSIIVGERYLDYFTTITEDRL